MEMGTSLNIQNGGLAGWGEGYNLVHVLAEEGYEAPLRLILDLEGLDLNLDASDCYGRTALHLATINRRLEIVQLLLTKKTDVDIRTEMGQETALHLAARNDDEKLIELLIKHEAEVEAQDHYHYTALHRAAFEGATNAVRVLLVNRADIGRRGNYGKTPLHCAVSHGHPNVVRLLLDEGADAAAQDHAGHIPLALTQRPDVIQVLCQRSHQSLPQQHIRRWTWF
jgi:ankyrin repeat protein